MKTTFNNNSELVLNVLEADGEVFNITLAELAADKRGYGDTEMMECAQWIIDNRAQKGFAASVDRLYDFTGEYVAEVDLYDLLTDFAYFYQEHKYLAFAYNNGECITEFHANTLDNLIGQVVGSVDFYDFSDLFISGLHGSIAIPCLSFYFEAWFDKKISTISLFRYLFSHKVSIPETTATATTAPAVVPVKTVSTFIKGLIALFAFFALMGSVGTVEYNDDLYYSIPDVAFEEITLKLGDDASEQDVLSEYQEEKEYYDAL